MMTHLYWYLDTPSPHKLKKRCQSWVPLTKPSGSAHVFRQSCQGHMVYDNNLYSMANNALHVVETAKSDSDVMFCLQTYQGLRIDRSLVY